MKNSLERKPRKSIKYNDCFGIGNHLLLCADATDAAAVGRLFKKHSIKLLLVDPPYGISAVESKDGFSPLKKNKPILNDGITSEIKYAQFTQDWLKPIVPHLAAKNAAYVFNSDRMIFALRDGMQQAGWKFGQLLIWIKNHPVIGRLDYLPEHELIAYGWRGAHEFRKSKDHSVLFCPKPNRNPLHPTQKPISLLRRLILNSTSIGDVVYDPFAGSGSTGIACEQTRRRSVMIERDEEYCQTIIDRFERLFGVKAERSKL